MRIGVSGTHGTGKTTLVGELCARLPGHTSIDEPYVLLKEDGYEFEFPRRRTSSLRSPGHSQLQTGLPGREPDTTPDRSCGQRSSRTRGRPGTQRRPDRARRGALQACRRAPFGGHSAGVGNVSVATDPWADPAHWNVAASALVRAVVFDGLGLDHPAVSTLLEVLAPRIQPALAHAAHGDTPIVHVRCRIGV